MKMIRRTLSVLLSGTLFLAVLTGCHRDNQPDDVPVTKTQLLTNVFKGTAVAVPENYTSSSGVAPYYDPTTGELAILSSHSVETGETNEYGNPVWERKNILVTLNADGTLVSETELDLGEEVYVNEGVLTGEKLYFTVNDYDPETGRESYYLTVYDLSSGESIRSGELSGLFSPTERPWFYINYIAVDGEGDIYLNSESEILILDTNFQSIGNITAPSWIDNMITAADGTVYAETWLDNGRSFVPIDKTAKTFGSPLTLPDTLKANQYFFGNGYDIFFIDQSGTGLYGYNIPDETAAKNPETIDDAVLLFDFANSDLYENNIEILQIVDPDRVILYERDPVSYERTIMLYNRSEDIDLSQIRVLELAFVYSDYDLPLKIVTFNKSQTDLRIITKDYSSYITEENPDGGSQKLISEILNGLYKPDMISSSMLSDPVIRQMYDNSLYTDLYPYLDKSETVRREDLLGCVSRTMESDTGALWGIATSFSIDTLIAPASLLGDRDGWTLSEILALAESLPEDSFLMERLHQGSASQLLGSDGYGMFLDRVNGTCHFENNPEFLAYLTFLRSLPADYSEAQARMNTVLNKMNLTEEDSYVLRLEGKIALDSFHYYGINDWVRDIAAFGTTELNRIGYPTADGRNGTTISLSPYMITSFCEYPDDAWAFLESILTPAEDEMFRGGRDGFPVLRSSLNMLCEEYMTYMFDIQIEGNGMSWGPYDPEYDDVNAPMDEPGYRKFFTAEDAAALTDWLDKEIGRPVTGDVDAEINAIIAEEISTYLGGSGSAEDCARVIQSRVNIWLAEHQ